MQRIYLAGATGAIGRRLVPLLRQAGHSVTGTTRSTLRADALRAQGVAPVVVDMFDAEAVRRSLETARPEVLIHQLTDQTARPEVLIHQLTDLPAIDEPEALAAARLRNARLREATAPILVRAALAAGVRRVIVQSIAFAYAPGAAPHGEGDRVDAPSVRTMEETFLDQAGIETVILRYGRLWGPGTWSEMKPAEAPTVHVDAAAHAALLAVTRGSGVYNIAEPSARVRTERAERELGFEAGFRLQEKMRD